MQKIIERLIISFIFLFIGLRILAQLLNPSTLTNQSHSIFFLYAFMAFISSLFIFRSKLPGQEVKLTLDNIKLFSAGFNIFIISFIFYAFYLDFLQIEYGQTYLDWFTTFFSKPWINLFIASTALMQVTSLFEHKDRKRIIAFTLLSLTLLFLEGSEAIRESSLPLIRALPQFIYLIMMGIAHFSIHSKKNLN